jgi:glyoxylase-like metal-dependent hydrolase (beta-lactamase superfamily II)
MLGWPGTLPRLLNILKRRLVQLQVKHLLLMHYHPDYAGLAQRMKQKGFVLVVMESQQSSIPKQRS